MAWVQLGPYNAAFQLVSGYIGVGSTLPTTGGLRLDNNTAITSVFTGTNYTLAYVDTSGNVNFGDTAQKTRIHSSTVGAIELWQSGVRKFYFSGDNFVIETGATTGALYLGTVTVRAGTGSPEGVITAPTGSLYLNLSGGAGTTLYVKQSGAGNTGWVGK